MTPNDLSDKLVALITETVSSMEAKLGEICAVAYDLAKQCEKKDDAVTDFDQQATEFASKFVEKFCVSDHEEIHNFLYSNFRYAVQAATHKGKIDGLRMAANHLDCEHARQMDTRYERNHWHNYYLVQSNQINKLADKLEMSGDTGRHTFEEVK